MAKKAVARQIGTYDSERDEVAINILSTKISRDKSEYVEIKFVSPRCVVSSLDRDSFPEAYGLVREIGITKKNLEEALFVTAGLIRRGIISRSYFRRERRMQKQFYFVFNYPFQS